MYILVHLQYNTTALGITETRKRCKKEDTGKPKLSFPASITQMPVVLLCFTSEALLSKCDLEHEALFCRLGALPLELVFAPLSFYEV